MVYSILNQEGLCNYYSLNDNPGSSQAAHVRKDKFAFLDNETIHSKLINFRSNSQVHVTLGMDQCLFQFR